MTHEFLPSVEESYHRLLEHIPGMAYRCRVEKARGSEQGFEYVLEFVSRGSFDLLGIPAGDMIEQNQNVIERMTHPDDLPRQRQSIYDKVVMGQPYQAMYRLILPGGRVKWVWDQGEGVTGPDGGLWYLEGLMMDVSEQKFMELSLREENRQFKTSSDSLFGLGGMVGKSEAMRKVYELVLKAAETESNIIIYGETGSGKDVAARAIHALSGRRGPYVPVNCGAIPESLMESEFFGHTKGAFSGATGNKEGYIGAANNGTLFLDEIGELSASSQARLLQFLEDRTVERVGSSQARRLDVRVIAATNRNLAASVERREFREDLYYRLNVFECRIPPLRERREDIPFLARRFLQEAALRNGLTEEPRLSEEILSRLCLYEWPGNVRELRNAMERAAVLAAGREVKTGDLPAALSEALAGEGGSLRFPTLREVEEAHIRRVLGMGVSMERAAEMLGINSVTLWRKRREMEERKKVEHGAETEV